MLFSLKVHHVFLSLKLSPVLAHVSQACLILEKGFIAIDGVSLTVVSKDTNSFQVSVVDFTQKHTALGKRRMDDMVNLEVDIIAKYVEQLSQPRNSGITVTFLQEHGFLVD